MNEIKEYTEKMFEDIKHIDETTNDIAKRKKLRYREDILDNIGSHELIVNLFRISQTKQKLKNNSIKVENNTKNMNI